MTSVTMFILRLSLLIIWLVKPCDGQWQQLEGHHVKYQDFWITFVFLSFFLCDLVLDGPYIRFFLFAA